MRSHRQKSGSIDEDKDEQNDGDYDEDYEEDSDEDEYGNYNEN